jgi:tetratricopeptide (TPR) repeat protein
MGVWRRAFAALGLICLWLAGSAAQAVVPKAKAQAARPGPSGEGYRSAPLPAWVVAAPTAPSWTPPPGGKARRDELVDVQVRLAGAATQTFVRFRHVALDPSTLQSISEPQIHFNPSYQRLVLHQASVRRSGVVSDRLRQARIEPLRREQGLDQRQLTGLRTLLLVLPDVRVGDAVELAYTLEGENPIFEGQYAESFALASDAPLDQLQLRIDAPATQTLHFKTLGALAPADLQPQPSRVGDRQVWQLRRQHVPPVVDEQGVPPWVQHYPAWQISSWRDWGDVQAWARRLFQPAEPDAALRELAQRLRDQHATPAARAAAALQFVQDEVRYFSLSLGESSHRPKPAAQTLAERLGDCKDKVLLLNQLFALLDLKAEPVLVSVRRQRGVVDSLPGHERLDHVVSRLSLDGRDWILDPTLSGQGLGLAERGHLDYGQGLPVNDSGALQRLEPAPEPAAAVVWHHRWDLSRKGRAALLEVELETFGLSAEHLRATLQLQGREVWQGALVGNYLSTRPGLRLLGDVEIDDDRVRNRWRAKLKFEHPKPAHYERGGLRLQVPLVELQGLLQAPPEAKRQFPFMLTMPRGVEHRLSLYAPHKMPQSVPAPVQLQGPGFAFTQRFQVEGALVKVVSRLERRGDQVLPDEVERLREQLRRLQAQFGTQVGMPLFDREQLKPEFDAAERRLQRLRSGAPDQLDQILAEQEVRRLFGSAALRALGETSPQAVGALAERGVALNLLGEFAPALADAEAALRLESDNAEALDVKGVALLSLGRVREALPVFQQLAARDDDTGAKTWLAIGHHLLGQGPEAEAAARQQVERSSGESREFALLWLYLTAERHRRGGADALAKAQGEAPAADAPWPAPIQRYLRGALGPAELLQAARQDERQRRLRLAEAQYFIGAQLAAQGQDAQARPWFERTLETRALPYREHTLARLALQGPAR